MAYQASDYSHSSVEAYYPHRDDGHATQPPPPPDWDPEALGQAFLSEESQSDWSAVTNLDQFFCKVYTYYVEKGFWCMIAARITNLVTLAFTICFSTFLLLFVNWPALVFCDSMTACQDVFSLRQGVFSNPSTSETVVFIYFGIFCVYWLWNFLSFVYTLRDAFEMRTFYKEDLAIVDDDLVSLEWHYILESLVHVSARKKLCIVKDLTALDITNRIMRKENFMIAMINLDLFQFGARDAQGVWNAAVTQCCKAGGSRRRSFKEHELQEQPRKVLRERPTRGGPLNSPPPARALKNPLLDGAGTHPLHVNTTSVNVASSYSTFPLSPTAAHPSSRLASAGSKDAASASAATPPFTSWWAWAVMGTTLDWNLRFCVLNSLFDSHFYVHSSYLGPSGIAALKMRFVVLGVANLLLMPFIMLFMTIFFVLKHAEELHSKKTLFGPRQWCNLAQWKLREFNELPHFFERRLTLSSVAAQQYMQQFPNTLVSIIAQSVAYITGALVAVLLLLTVTDSDVISHRIFDRTLLWYLAVFSAILALSRSMIPDKTIYPAPALVMAEVVKHTHYSPAHWRDRTHTGPIHREFTYMYPSRLSMFLFEIMSVVMTPLVLIFCLPHSAERIVQFVVTRTVNVQGVGHLCAYAMFDLEKHGDGRYSQIPTTATATGLEQKDGTAYRTPGGGHPPPLGPLSRMTSSSTPAVPAFPLRLKHGKMEKSFLGFSMANPHWKPVSQEDGGSGAKFLSSLADTLYGPPETTAGEPMVHGANHLGDSPPRKFRGAGESTRFASDDSGHGAAASSHLPDVSASMARQDSLDSSTTDEGFDGEETGDGTGHPNGHTAKSTGASYMLSQSDRHLITSFADLVGMDPAMQSVLHPSTIMRQSSYGGMGGMGGGGAHASMLGGMSTVLGLNHRGGGRAPHASPPRGGGRGGDHMQQSHMMRSHLGGGMGASSLYHPSTSLLMSSSIYPRGAGGLQGGLSASTMMRLDAQAQREQLMLAQADQQADLFALLESRLIEEEPLGLDEGDEDAGSQEEDDDTPRQSPISAITYPAPPHPTAVHVFAQPQAHSQPPPRGGMDIPHSGSAPRHDPSPFSTSAERVKPASFDARQYGTSITPPTGQPLLAHASAAAPHAADDNEPPPMSFFN